eukprot:11221844-Lingulodinium_polyedra.AAC.1
MPRLRGQLSPTRPWTLAGFGPARIGGAARSRGGSLPLACAMAWSPGVDGVALCWASDPAAPANHGA